MSDSFERKTVYTVAWVSGTLMFVYVLITASMGVAMYNNLKMQCHESVDDNTKALYNGEVALLVIAILTFVSVVSFFIWRRTKHLRM